MTKTKTPFFGLTSKGTVGGSLTSQRRGNATLLRQKPIPTDPYSLAQAYQRWLYQDYAYLWSKQSAATKHAYRTLGSRQHLTAFQSWIKYMLTNLPDIAAWWKLDDNLGPTAADSSRNNNPATIIGASPATGQIDGCLSFDGINDYLNCGTHPIQQAALALPFTYELYLYGTPPYPAATQFLITNTNFPYAYQNDNGKINFVNRFTTAGAINISTPINANYINTWILIHLIWDGTFLLIYVNGIQAAISVNLAGDTSLPHAGPLQLGRIPANMLTGHTDNFILYSRALDAAESLTHSKRRYPP